MNAGLESLLATAQETGAFLIAEDSPDYEEVPIDINFPEDVLIRVYQDDMSSERGAWKGFGLEVEEIAMHRRDGDPDGAASYDSEYGGFLDYTIMANTSPPNLGKLEEGMFVVEDITGMYHKGDGWTTDDDMDFYMDDPRPATPEEIAACYGASFWDSAS